jgi:hypothetical protein
MSSLLRLFGSNNDEPTQPPSHSKNPSVPSTRTSVDTDLARLEAQDYVAEHFAPIALRLHREFSDDRDAERQALYPPAGRIGSTPYSRYCSALREAGEDTLSRGVESVKASLSQRGVEGQETAVLQAFKEDLHARIAEYEREGRMFF